VGQEDKSGEPRGQIHFTSPHFITSCHVETHTLSLYNLASAHRSHSGVPACMTEMTLLGHRYLYTRSDKHAKVMSSPVLQIDQTCGYAFLTSAEAVYCRSLYRESLPVYHILLPTYMYIHDRLCRSERHVSSNQAFGCGCHHHRRRKYPNCLADWRDRF